MKILRTAVLAAVLLPGCNTSFESYPCRSSRQVITSRRIDFESTCGGAPCDAVSVGAVSLVPSLLPGDHALSIGPDASITWTWNLPGTQLGAAIGVNLRCDDGGTLRLRSIGRDGSSSEFTLPSTDRWSHESLPLQRSGQLFASRDAAQEGSHAAVLELRNVGRARCVIDELFYGETAEVCLASAPCGVDLYRDRALLCGTTCVDPRVDPNNCGGCGVVCSAGQHCNEGLCREPSTCFLRCVGRVCGVDECGMGSCGVCQPSEHCTPGGLCAPGSATDAGVVDGGVRDGGVRDAGAVDGGGDDARLAVVAGRACRDDGACATPGAPLRCVATPGGSVCSLASGCRPASMLEEEAQCGGRYARCLLQTPGDAGALRGFCTRSCVAGARTEATGACPPHAVCTGSWFLSLFDPTNTGCIPFCHDDADCAGLADAGADGGAAVCNVWTGRCGPTAPSPLAAADGTRCDPTSPVHPCRGMCFTLDPDRPTEGLCGSLIDRRAMPRCPEPDVLPVGPSGDDLAACVTQACASNADCRGGLVCVYPEDDDRIRTDDGSPRCAYPTARQPLGIVPDGGLGLDASMD